MFDTFVLIRTVTFIDMSYSFIYVATHGQMCWYYGKRKAHNIAYTHLPS
jgi:hypothetical protein